MATAPSASAAISMQFPEGLLALLLGHFAPSRSAGTPLSACIVLPFDWVTGHAPRAVQLNNEAAIETALGKESGNSVTRAAGAKYLRR